MITHYETRITKLLLAFLLGAALTGCSLLTDPVVLRPGNGSDTAGNGSISVTVLVPDYGLHGGAKSVSRIVAPGTSQVSLYLDGEWFTTVILSGSGGHPSGDFFTEGSADIAVPARTYADVTVQLLDGSGNVLTSGSDTSGVTVSPGGNTSVTIVTFPVTYVPLTVNADPVSQTVGSGSMQYNSFPALQGSVYTVTLAAASGNPDMFVFGSDGLPTSGVTYGSDHIYCGTGTPCVLTVTAAATGDHWIGVFGYGASSTYTLEVTADALAGNLLLNPAADNGTADWDFVGPSGATAMPVSGQNVFYLQSTNGNPGYFSQNVVLPTDSGGKWLTLLGYGWVAAAVEGSITRHPYLYGNEMDASSGTLNYLQGMIHGAPSETWEAITGVFQLDAAAYQILFQVAQGEGGGDPPDGTPATVDDLEIRVFDTEAEALAYRDAYLTAHPTVTEQSALAYDVLILSYGDASTEMASALSAYGDITPDLSLQETVPTVEQLELYDAVYVSTNNPTDMTTLSDNLVQYLDGGGRVILATFDWLPYTGLQIEGALLNDYSPFQILGSSLYTSATLVTDPHPVTDGVSSFEAFYRDNVSLSSGATQIAAWSDGYPAVAQKGGVIGINAAMAAPSTVYSGGWTGDGWALLHDAILYLVEN